MRPTAMKDFSYVIKICTTPHNFINFSRLALDERATSALCQVQVLHISAKPAPGTAHYRMSVNETKRIKRRGF